MWYDDGGNTPPHEPPASGRWTAKTDVIPKRAACERCGGRGWVPEHGDAFGPTRDCPDCSHATRNVVAEFVDDDEQEPTCPDCRGTGLSPYSIRDVGCRRCGGMG